MTNSAAWSGDYADFKLIKTRKVFQVVIEMPIEQAAPFVAAFGMPDPSTGVPVALARLDPNAKPEKPKRSWSELSRAEQAGIACNEPEFRKFLAKDSPAFLMLDLDMAAQDVRAICKVESRSDIDLFPDAIAAWDKLYSDYQLWKRGAAA